MVLEIGDTSIQGDLWHFFKLQRKSVKSILS
jgi:hypothetical protein